MKTVPRGNISDHGTGVRSIASRGVATLFALALVSGCSVTNPSVPEVVSTDKTITSSVAKAAKPKGVAGGDAEIIKTTVASAPDADSVKPLAWQNPETGSSGTIMAIDRFMGKHGQSCRGFKTSVATFMGIALYNGETCQISPGEWVLSWFKPSE